MSEISIRELLEKAIVGMKGSLPAPKDEIFAEAEKRDIQEGLDGLLVHCGQIPYDDIDETTDDDIIDALRVWLNIWQDNSTDIGPESWGSL